MLDAHEIAGRIGGAEFAPAFGHVTSITPHLIEADGPACILGQLCEVGTAGTSILAEVIAVHRGRLSLSPLGAAEQVRIGARVEISQEGGTAPVGDAFAGRAIDSLGRAIDGGRAILAGRSWPIQGDLPSPLDRQEPREPLETGIRSLDGLMTLGRGQRVGIFAASGVGKTSLIEQLAGQADADRVVLCLVGERGREVEELWRSVSGRKDRERFALVAATSDESAPSRARAPLQALCLAEYWRSRGEHVLLIIDSVTRLAMALREIGLAAGAPPTVRAYTPNVFSALPRLVERCGALKGKGAITAIMTVLSETDEVDDPIVEVMKSLLDGHVILSRSLAEQGQFPAIDPLRSVSRGLEKRIGQGQRKIVAEALRLMSSLNEAKILIDTGAYRPGTNPLLDRAIAKRDALLSFCRQGQDEHVALEEAGLALARAVGDIGHG